MRRPGKLNTTLFASIALFSACGDSGEQIPPCPTGIEFQAAEPEDADHLLELSNAIGVTVHEGSVIPTLDGEQINSREEILCYGPAGTVGFSPGGVALLGATEERLVRIDELRSQGVFSTDNGLGDFDG